MKLLNYFKYPDYQDSHVNKHDLVSIYFSADWCEPCVGMNFMLVSKSGIGHFHPSKNLICGKRFHDVLYPAGRTKYLFIFSVYDQMTMFQSLIPGWKPSAKICFFLITRELWKKEDEKWLYLRFIFLKQCENVSMFL